MVSLQLRTDFSSFLADVSDVDTFLQTCCNSMGRLHQYVEDVKSFRNTLLPVARLPEDVLIHIFCAVRGHNDYEKYRSYPIPDTFPQSWLWLTHVCRRWREIALRYSLLWTQVIRGRRDIFEAFLERSSGCPVAFLDRYHSTESDVPSAWIISESHRSSYIHCDNFAKALVQHCQLLHTPLRFPLLEDLGFCFEFDYDHLINYGLLSRIDLPLLRRLRFNQCEWLVIENSVRPSLTHLEVENTVLRYASVDQWVTLLGNLPLLEELRLAASVFLDNPFPQTAVVRLPKLRLIHIRQGGIRPNVWFGPSALLPRIISPWDTHIQVEVPPSRGFSHAELEYSIACVSDRLSKLPSASTLRVSKLTFGLTQGKLVLAATSGPSLAREERELYRVVWLPANLGADWC